MQLGGDDAQILAQAARVCEDRGYDEINLNIGCPSDRVQQGHFGAVLMKDPRHVADLFQAVQAAVRAVAFCDRSDSSKRNAAPTVCMHGRSLCQ